MSCLHLIDHLLSCHNTVNDCSHSAIDASLYCLPYSNCPEAVFFSNLYINGDFSLSWPGAKYYQC